MSTAERHSRSGSELLQNTYRVSYDHLLGEGAFATVYKGMHQESLIPCAVKIYKGDLNGDDQRRMMEEFNRGIEIMESLHKQDLSKLSAMDAEMEETQVKSPRGSTRVQGSKDSQASFAARMITQDAQKGAGQHASEIVAQMDLKTCFVEMQSYSKNKLGEPGIDIMSEKLFMVYELGGQSLAAKLKECAAKGTSLEVDDLRAVQWSLVSIVCGLHAADFVHLDIKPANIIQFSCGWKLIDFDGAVRTQTELPIENVQCTTIYMAPEMSRAILSAKKSQNGYKSLVKVSRLMDVWSVGMCALEAVALEPVCKSMYDEWMAETKSEDKFLKWLADVDSDPIVSGEVIDILIGIDRNMADMLRGMLDKNATTRMSIPECFVHPWFEPIRAELWKSRKQDKPETNDRRGSKSVAAITEKIRAVSDWGGDSRACCVM
eukprot:gnl/TRDRNA2_/TRDRNA2_167516_c0_seq4.p1 gnl/TRDRNA2_/TRDRNA2_167516_c0~~gnl/TRDRNA2_/TRDRNA2_167516_c0_seq4.p1  ORF type:complete len:433 (+),score=89.74 gnl/TRDRNA2_/TRDRNA2_167516_c0_seq4:67-1365(+)